MLSAIKKRIHRVRDSREARRAQRVFGERRDNLLVLNYHRVLARDFAELDIVEPGMYVFDDTFRMHLMEASRRFQAVDLAHWIAGDRDKGGKPAFAVTFDDGWKDNHDVALPILEDLGIPATVFVVSQYAGSARSFWPERLARRLKTMQSEHRGCSAWLDSIVTQAGLTPGSGLVTAEQTSRAIACAKRLSDEAINAELDQIDAELGPSQPAAGRDLADWDELKRMAGSGLVSLGSHTRGHVRMLPDLHEDDVHSEIAGSRDDIERHTGQRPQLFCYPNGDVSKAARAVVAECYRGACTTVRGWNSAVADPYALRRVALHEDRSHSPTAFLARLVQAA